MAAPRADDMGGYFSAYHCNRGHYFRKPKKEFDEAVENFVKNITVAPEYIDALISKMGEQLDKQLITLNQEAVTIDLRIANLKDQIRQSVDKIRFLSSATAIKYMEEDIEKMEEEITELSAKRETLQPQKPSDIEKASAFVRHFLEHLDELLLRHENPVLQAKYFGVLFNQAPTYENIELGTPDISKITGVNSIFTSLSVSPKTHSWVSIPRWEPLLSDYLMLVQKLEQLDFTYYRGKVTVVDPEVQK